MRVTYSATYSPETPYGSPATGYYPSQAEFQAAQQNRSLPIGPQQSTQTYQQPSGYKADVLGSSDISRVREAMKVGTLSPEAAFEQVRRGIPHPSQNPKATAADFVAYENALNNYRNQLFQPMDIMAGGNRPARLNADGSISVKSTQNNTTTVGAFGVNSTVQQNNVDAGQSFDYNANNNRFIEVPKIERNLTPGMKGQDVRDLQNFLIKNGYQIPSGATGNYGNETKAAVTAWQNANKIDTQGNPGYFGPISKAYIAIQSAAYNTGQALVASGYQFNPAMTGGGEGGSNGGGGFDMGSFDLVDYKSLLDEAQKVVSPFYKQQLDFLKKDLETNLTDLGVDLTRVSGQITRQANRERKTGNEDMAERGLAFSSNRKTFNDDLTVDTNDALAQKADIAFRSGRDLVTKAERVGGSNNLMSTALPQLGGRSLSFGGGVTGDLEYEQKEKTDTLARLLASDENLRRQEAYNRNLRSRSYS